MVFVEFGDAQADVGHTTVYVSQLGAQFCHLVNLVYAAAGQEVETVEVFLVRGNLQTGVGLLYADNGFKDGALAVLDPLTHRVQVGGEVNACGEDTLAVLALALAIELLPPFAQVVQLRLVVGSSLFKSENPL